MTLTPFGWLVIVGVVFLCVSWLCQRWLDRLDRKRRPISEHTDDWYRPHNGANGRGFR